MHPTRIKRFKKYFTDISSISDKFSNISEPPVKNKLNITNDQQNIIESTLKSGSPKDIITKFNLI